jgi:hypothetical protein
MSSCTERNQDSLPSLFFKRESIHRGITPEQRIEALKTLRYINLEQPTLKAVKTFLLLAITLAVPTFLLFLYDFNAPYHILQLCTFMATGFALIIAFEFADMEWERRQLIKILGMTEEQSRGA